MHCTQANWCRKEPIVYEDDKGKYCVFHAPKGKKGISLEEFNKKIFERINDVIHCNKLPTASGVEKKPNPCNLSNTIFEGDISFERYNKDNPLPHISFLGAKFYGNTNFSGTVFKGTVSFVGTKFYGETIFRYTEFYENAGFMAKFAESVNFTAAKFHSSMNFIGTIFHKEVKFYNTIFEIAYFNSRTFHDIGILRRLNIGEKIRLEGVNLQRVSFLDTDLRKVEFINCDWPVKKFREKVLYDEIEIFKLDKKERSKGKIDKIETLYRRLKQKYTDEHDWPEVSIWHYGEKEMFRKKRWWRRFLPSISNLYWLSSGYGERPVRAGVVLLLLILCTSFLMWLTEFIRLQGVNYGTIDFVSSLLTIFQYASFQKEPIFIPTSIWQEYLATFIRIIVPIQTALFILALKNRFKR